MHYDVIVIGAGPGGYECASLLAKKGKNVALIEKNQIGGTCLNEGCVPAKHYLESANYVAKKSYFESCGVHVENISLDMNILKNKKSELIEQLRTGINTKLKKSKVTTIFGSASFENENSIRVNDEIISADKFVIASGSIHRPHPLLEVDGKQIISSKEVFELEKIPSSILIVGGGAIGCEFATFFNSIGVDVHIAEFTPNIVPAEDVDVAKGLKRELEKKGIKISINTNVTSYVKNEKSVSIKMDTPKGEIDAEYELVLVSIGRSPNTSELDLKNASIQSEKGFITVNENLLTSNPNVYAIGDVIATPALAHSAYNEANVVTNNITKNTTCKPSKTIPFVTFCQPQVASVGKNEKTLKEFGIEYEVIKHFYKSSAKAKIKGDDGGFIKLLCEKETGTILGGAMIGNDTTEHIHQILIAINTKLTKDDLAKMVFAHPTLSESLWEMVQD
ncbi:dihydrolipoyl dehydrogenase [Sulfurospirillum arcachonense]|uniref:dihydrolipoyl dehydrogenase n=1 Tax=Sulfurospirillum arcachonense TaxID=57666 RepID=UPI0004B510AD|nr:dihydrolipoyl dehydrogenase [Sulfurospirillum arcachonense]